MKYFKIAVLATILLTSITLTKAADQTSATQAVSKHYLKIDEALRYDELLNIYSPDAVFFDPTADVFQGPIAKGPIVGAKEIVALQKSWGLAEQAFAVKGSFAVGDIALHHGVITVRYHGAQQKYPIPFVTVHNVREGRITARTDFGEYVKSLGLGDSFDENAKTTKIVAEEYLKAYLAADLKRQAELSADNIVFQDPTSKVFHKEAGHTTIVGRDKLMHQRAKTFAKVTNFGLDVAQSFVANHHAVYIGTTTYTVAGRKWAQPAVFIIEVRDGRVTRHWDYVDYSVGPTD